MSYPTKYTRQSDYVAYQNTNPTRPLPATYVHADLNLAVLSIGEIVEFLKTSLRADGAIMNGAIGYDQLSASLQTAGLAPADAWAASTAYAEGDSVIQDYTLYRCLVDHTSGTFSADLASAYWVLVTELPQGEQGEQGDPGLDGIQLISGTPTVNQFTTWVDATTVNGVSITGLVKGNGASAPTAAVVDTDYLAPAAIGVTVQAYDAQLSSLVRQNSQSAAYTLVLTDGGKHIYHPAADTTARIWTIPANASVAFPIGTVVTFDNDFGAGALTISITTDTLVLVGAAGSTGSRTLASGGQATAIKVTSTRWRISGTGLT